MKLIKKIFIWVLCAIGIFFISEDSTAQAQTTESPKENYTFLLKNPNQLNKFLKELDIKNTDTKVTVIEEIGLVYIEDSGSKENLQQELAPYSRKLDGYISAEGELPEMEIPVEEPNIADVKDTGEHKLSVIQNSALTSPYFKPFNWYLEDVTNNYQSQNVNKGEDTSIALIDSGIDQTHPLLSNHINLSLGKNYTSKDANLNDEMGHGTSVAGILTSIAPNMTIVPYKVLGAESGESVWVLKAIIDATNDGNDILNLSLGTYKSKNLKEDQLLIKAYEAATKYANKHGVLVVSAAGNLSKNLDESKDNNEIYLPGNLKNVITVSSNSNADTVASYSNYGKNIDFSAPGGDLNEDFDIQGLILTTFPTDKPNNFIDQAIGIPSGYTLSNGTSLSAPQVSATAALIISEYKEINGKNPKINKIVKYLKKGAIDLGNPGHDIYFGYGKVNAYQSLVNIK